MKNARLLLPSLLILCACMSAACGGSQQEQGGPKYAKSSANERYAAAYPAEVGKLDESTTSGNATATTEISKIKTYPDELKNPDWTLTKEILVEADRAGRSEEMHELIDSQRTITTFVESDGEDISRRVGRTVDAEAQKSGLKKDFETRRPIKSALPTTIDQQLKEQLHEQHESFILIETHRDKLGKDNAAALELQAESITLTAHYVFVELELNRAEMKKRASEVDDVRSTIDEGITKHQAIVDNPNASASEKKVSGERLKALQQAKTDLNPQVEAAKKRQENLDKEIDKLQKDYQTAFDALIKDLDERIKSQGGGAK